ncbi:MAG: hypothetical protein H6672_15490 [Anaerolineaceae bacterium]|nr:hypothetical protein [Anaerolineaceae bacterium]
MRKSLIILTMVIFTAIPIAYAQNLSACLIDLPDRPALPSHIEQADILNGTLSLEELLAQFAALNLDDQLAIVNFLRTL